MLTWIEGAEVDSQIRSTLMWRSKGRRDQYARYNQPMNVIAPLIVGSLYVCLCSFFKEPNRRNFNAIMVAGAGAAYLSGGFGLWEFAFTAIVTFCAYHGLRSYHFIGIAWFLHTGW